MEPSLSNRLCAAVRSSGIRPWLATDFGTGGPSSSDLDFVVVLDRSPCFTAAVCGLCKLFRSFQGVPLKACVFPTFEIRSFLPESNLASLHLLVYADPWIFWRLEATGVRNAIIQASASPLATPTRPSRDIADHFDLLQKVANSFVLLLNSEPALHRSALLHGRRVALYVARWAPVALAEWSDSKSASLDVFLDYYEAIQ